MRQLGISGLVFVLAALAGCAAAPASVAAAARDYYFSPRGDDARGDGSSMGPFRSVGKASGIRLNPGDRLLFEGGEVFRGNLTLSEGRGGTAERPIVVGSFGKGRARIDAGEGYAVRVRNAGGIVIEHLVLSGSGADRNFGSGVALTNDLHGWAAKRLGFVRVRNVTAYGFGREGINVEAARGLGFEDVRIEDCETYENGHSGIYVSGERRDWRSYPHANVYVGRCVARDNPGDPDARDENRSGSGIFVTGVDGAVVEHCSASGNGRLCRAETGGPMGIWASESNRVIIQMCRSTGNRTGGRHDGGGFGLDGGVSNSIVQYNYSSGNDGSGFGLFEYAGAPQWHDNTRMWLDVVRYADTSGCNSDFPIPDMYRYRNWVIDAFNADKPYDQFLKEQLAGDLMPQQGVADRNEKIVATGYLANARRFGSRNNEFHLTIEDTIDNVGKAMLGLSVSCARCHDHKFDPIPTTDYYALYGIFASTKYSFPGTEIYRHPKDMVALGGPEDVKTLAAWAGRLADLDDKYEVLLRERDQRASAEKRAKDLAEKAATQPSATRPVAASSTQPSPAASRAALATVASSKPATTQPHVRTSADVKAEMQDIQAEMKRLEANPPKLDKAYAVLEGKPADAKVQIKGEPKILGPEVRRGFLTILGGQKLPADEKGSGRLELAEWIASPTNPLIARVMVNRIWQGHFGVGLVKTPNDFGVRGQRPTHPELLDYLASRFVKSGWSMKAMHRTIMLSRAYQLASTDDARDASIDPTNDLLWRFNPRRLSAEEIRDSILALAGTLERSMGGPHPFPPQTEWKFSQHRPFVADYDTNRRSVYLMQQRIRKQPFLATFDGADTNAPTGVRSISTTAIQALWMMNDPFVHEQSDQFAAVIGGVAADAGGRIDAVYRRAVGRPATTEEIDAGVDYVRECAARLAPVSKPPNDVNRAALASFNRVIFASNEFLFVE